MKSRALVCSILAASLADGVLVGGGIDRALVAMPAWHRVGPIAWATFSRHADLGNGLFLYPLEAFGGMILSVVAAVLFRRDGTAPRAARMPIYAAALFTIGGLVLTVKAAPIMLGVKNVGDDLAVLQRAFDDFEFWGILRLVSQALGYLANMWSLVAILRAGSEPRKPWTGVPSADKPFTRFQSLQAGVCCRSAGNRCRNRSLP